MLLASMIEAAHTFVQRAAQLAAQEGASGPISLPAAVYRPFQSQLDRWASFGGMQAPVTLLLEYCCLLGCLASMKLMNRVRLTPYAAVLKSHIKKIA